MRSYNASQNTISDKKASVEIVEAYGMAGGRRGWFGEGAIEKRVRERKRRLEGQIGVLGEKN